MASKVEICNRALQKLGAERITSLTEDSVNARACNVAYEPVKLSELRAHPWNFAIKRAQLPASATPPEFGRPNSFPLPSDFVRLMPPYPEANTNDLDWQIEGKQIYTFDSAPLNVRYIYNVTDPNEMDVLFREALATKIALELCEEFTQSPSKKADIKDDYKNIIREARRTNGIENVAQQPPEDTFITARV